MSETQISEMSGNVLYGLNDSAWTLALDEGSVLASDFNYFFHPYEPKQITTGGWAGRKTFPEWQVWSGMDGNSADNWFTLSSGDPPLSRVFLNSSGDAVSFSLLGRLYQDLDQNPLADSGVTGPQLALLDWLAASPDCGVGDVATGLGLTAPTVSVGVRRLEKAGLLERKPDPKDGRAIRLSLTAQGHALQEQAHAFRREKMRCVLAGLTTEEAETLVALLERAVSTAEETL